MGATTCDACVLEFDFDSPTGSEINFNCLFGPDEYLEDVGKPYTDVFALFLNQVNIAVIPGTSTPVAINTVNQNLNSEYFDSNEFGLALYPNFEPDGFTKLLAATGWSTNNVGSNHIKFVIAEVFDCDLDSWVLIEEIWVA